MYATRRSRYSSRPARSNPSPNPNPNPNPKLSLSLSLTLTLTLMKVLKQIRPILPDACEVGQYEGYQEEPDIQKVNARQP